MENSSIFCIALIVFAILDQTRNQISPGQKAVGDIPPNGREKVMTDVQVEKMQHVAFE